MDKRKKIGIGGAVFLVLLVLAVLFHQNQEQKELSRYTASFLDVFDTRTDIVGYSTSEEDFVSQVSLLKERLEYYHKLFDIYNDYEGINNIKTINDNAGVAPVKVSQDIIDLLIFSQEMYELTDGEMNIAMGSVLKIWHNYRDAGINDPENAKLPPMEELEAASAYCGILGMEINEIEGTVYLPDANMSLDVGGIGKGYAVQRVAEYAKEIGMESVLLSVGGNICAVGHKTDGSAWGVGIQNPDLNSEEAYVEKVLASDVSVVTSGDYQRYYVVDGEKYCHIIDRDTLMPANYFVSVTIITEDSGKADALSTAVFNMPFEDGQVFVNRLEGVEAMWVFEDGTIEYSDNFKQYTAE
ncbi:MAG: FAD:protein FMN transferase [Roseburia sp.]|nr:FAD:protein FMN transferase [Roseburia sp.]